MNKLVFINGSSCIGKTTIAESLFYSIDNCGWIDPDQTWWSNRKDEHWETAIPYVLDNTIHCVNNYLKYGLNPIIISWFFPKIENIDYVVKNINGHSSFDHYMLTAKMETLLERHKKRGDIRGYADWMKLNENLTLPNTIKIDTDNKNIKEIVEDIRNRIQKV